MDWVFGLLCHFVFITLQVVMFHELLFANKATAWIQSINFWTASFFVFYLWYSKVYLKTVWDYWQYRKGLRTETSPSTEPAINENEGNPTINSLTAEFIKGRVARAEGAIPIKCLPLLYDDQGDVSSYLGNIFIHPVHHPFLYQYVSDYSRYNDLYAAVQNLEEKYSMEDLTLIAVGAISEGHAHAWVYALVNALGLSRRGGFEAGAKGVDVAEQVLKEWTFKQRSGDKELREEGVLDSP
jgi:hypothetical protein